MKVNKFFDRNEKNIKISIETSDFENQEWRFITDKDRSDVLDFIESAEKELVKLRKAIKSIPVTETKELAPGLGRAEIIGEVIKWINTGKLTNENWDSIYIHPKTKQVAYTKYIGEPEDDGYLKGFQLALDIETNKMIARNCDNIWKSMEKRGFKKVGNLVWFYSIYGNE